MWYLQRDGAQIGPMSDAALQALIASRQVLPDTPVWRHGFSAWLRADAIPDLFWPAAASLMGTAEHDSSLVAALTPVLASPWLRFWARMFDLVVWSGLVGAILGTIAPSVFQLGGSLSAPAANLLLAPIIFPFALLLDALSASVFGNTPGKAIAGIRILDQQGKPLPFKQQLKRNFGLYWWGLGAELPFISIVTLVLSYRHARRCQILRWDQATNSGAYVLHGEAVRLWAIGIAYAILDLSMNFLIH
jgi:uncharacterized RDD family membrane protein YckC